MVAADRLRERRRRRGGFAYQDNPARNPLVHFTCQLARSDHHKGALAPKDKLRKFLRCLMNSSVPKELPITSPLDDEITIPPRGVGEPDRRAFIGGVVAAGVAGAAGKASAAAHHHRVAKAVSDEDLKAHIDTVVVIYAENRSFNNLFADFPGLQHPLSAVPPSTALQRDRDGRILDRLPPVWEGLVSYEQSINGRKYLIGQNDLPTRANAPFELVTPHGEPLPHGVVTRDLVHAFYNNQLQINGGRNDGFVAWGDTGQMVMGRYGETSKLRLWKLAREFTLCDNFFMGAFGGSFLNHQYLVSAQPPFYPHADKSPAKGLIAVMEGDDPRGIRPKQKPTSAKSAMDGPVRFVPTALSPDYWAVNTMGPAYSPAITVDAARPLYADPNSPQTLPPQHHKTIGDVLSAKGVEWAWYAGGWDAALAGKGYDGDYPSKPNFQAHHQPLNYFANFAPGTAERAKRLRDGGTGESPETNRFLADIEAGRLPAVSFYKPEGDLNMHAGTSSVEAGDRHISRLVEALRSGPQWKHMLAVITFDENGGWWDHVAPPKGDRWGPGIRIPAVIVSPHARRGHVEHTIYDTGSIARFLTRRFNLEKLPGLTRREEAMAAAGGPPPGDLTEALEISA
jgi:acid phosphatase